MSLRNDVLKGKNVLIVDDHALNIYALKEFLLSMDINVYEAQNGQEAIDLLKRGEVHLDVVLLDMAMPDMDGFETLEKIRKDRDVSSVPVFAVTARAMKGDEEKCLEAGATEYISKPVNTKDLLTKMTKVLNENHERKQ
jgi:two-component system chemotaxis sensor kinase CheA